MGQFRFGQVSTLMIQRHLRGLADPVAEAELNDRGRAGQGQDEGEEGCGKEATRARCFETPPSAAPQHEVIV